MKRKARARVTLVAPVDGVKKPTERNGKDEQDEYLEWLAFCLDYQEMQYVYCTLVTPFNNTKKHTMRNGENIKADF